MEHLQTNPNRPHSLSPEQYKAKFAEGTFAPNPYHEIQRRAQGLYQNDSPLYEHNMVSPADQLVVGQINAWQKNFPEDVQHLPGYVQKTLSILRTKYTKNFYYWTAYRTAKAHLDGVAVGDTPADKRSAKIQSAAACPGARAAYVQCTDTFHAIPLLTRLTLPKQYQIDCRDPCIALEQCLEQHFKNWTKAVKAVNKLEDMVEYKQYYLDLERRINARETATVTDQSGADSEQAKNVHMTLWEYDPEFVSNKDVTIAETLFQVKRLFPNEYLNNQQYYDALKRPLSHGEQEEQKKIAEQYDIDYSNMQLDDILYNLEKQKQEAMYHSASQ